MNEQQYALFESWLSRRLNVRVLKKSDAFEMQFLAKVYDMLKSFGADLPSENEFLYQYATTLGPVVYMPDVADPRSRASVLVHEAQHVAQFFGRTNTKLPGNVGLWWLYVSEPEARARYEAEAELARIEFDYQTLGVIPSLDSVISNFSHGYSFRPEHTALIRDLLEAGITRLTGLGNATIAGNYAYEFLARHDLFHVNETKS